MEQYKVIKKIVEGYSINSPSKFSNKVIAKEGTIPIAERDYNGLGAVVVLRTKGGKYVCDLGSNIANEYCEKIE